MNGRENIQLLEIYFVVGSIDAALIWKILWGTLSAATGRRNQPIATL
jgi:hypothetical protein